MKRMATRTRLIGLRIAVMWVGSGQVEEIDGVQVVRADYGKSKAFGVNRSK